MAASSSQSASVVSYNPNTLEINDLPVALTINDLPVEIMTQILSYNDEQNTLFRLAELMTISKQFHAAVNQDHLWDACVNKWGIPSYESSASGKLTGVQVAQLVGVPMKNLERMTQHMITLKNALIEPSVDPLKKKGSVTAEVWMKSLTVEKTKRARWNAVSNFFATFGLPINKKGQVVKELPLITLSKRTSAFKKTPGVKIVKINSIPNQSKALIKTNKFKDKEALRNLFLTNKFLELSFQKNSELAIRDTACEVAFLSVSTILRDTKTCLDAYYRA